MDAGASHVCSSMLHVCDAVQLSSVTACIKWGTRHICEHSDIVQFDEPIFVLYYTQRWFLDANTRCFLDYNHIVMGVLALIFLIGLVLLIPAVILLVVFQKKIEVHKLILLL